MENLKPKKSKGLIVLVIILSILFIASLGYIYYSYNKEHQILKEKAEINTELKEANKEIEDLKDTSTGTESQNIEENNYLPMNKWETDDAKVYAIGSCTMAFSDSKNMYIVKDDSCVFSSFANTEDRSFKNGIAEKKTSVSSCEENGPVTTTWIKLNIKEEDISKVKIYNSITTSDATEDIYFIMKDGTVRVFISSGEDDNNLDGTQILKDYKVKDLEEKCMKDSEYSGCDKPIHKLTLQDGTKKDVTMKLN